MWHRQDRLCFRSTAAPLCTPPRRLLQTRRLHRGFRATSTSAACTTSQERCCSTCAPVTLATLRFQSRTRCFFSSTRRERSGFRTTTVSRSRCGASPTRLCSLSSRSIRPQQRCTCPSPRPLLFASSRAHRARTPSSSHCSPLMHRLRRARARARARRAARRPRPRRRPAASAPFAAMATVATAAST
eukprot:Amastigsp_a510160_20.p2 type:complete len:187 gc:universal Amastigsp_a510160_20:2134-1574(-)